MDDDVIVNKNSLREKIDPDRCPLHLIRHHPPLPDGMIENIAVMMVGDTVVEVGVAVEIEITTGG